MFELVINGETYEFKFGMKFVREMNKRSLRKVEGLDEAEEIGLSMAIARLFDRNLDALYDVLRQANEGFKPRLEQTVYDEWIENDDTDVEEVFKQVLDFFGKSNCTKIIYNRIKAEAAKVQ